jgi:hypothetical protein
MTHLKIETGVFTEYVLCHLWLKKPVRIYAVALKVKKVKGHLWVLQHLCLEGILYSYPNEFLHSSPEALHTKRRERPLLAKAGAISAFS